MLVFNLSSLPIALENNNKKIIFQPNLFTLATNDFENDILAIPDLIIMPRDTSSTSKENKELINKIKEQRLTIKNKYKLRYNKTLLIDKRKTDYIYK